MHRSIALPLVLALAAAPLAVACDKSGADAQAEANQAQAKADKDIAQAGHEAADKANQAQATADQKVASARADFSKTVEDYRHSVQSNLDALDKQVADLDAKSRTATGKAKADLDAKLVTIRAQRDQFASDFRSLGAVTATTFDAAKARLDKEWTDLKTTVDRAT